MKKTFLTIEITISLIHIICVKLAYVFVNSRATVFVLGVISILAVISSLVMFFASIHKDTTPVSILVVGIISLISFFEYAPTKINSIFLIICIVISAALSLTRIIVLNRRIPAKIYNYIINFIVATFLLFVFSVCQLSFINYAFDLTSPNDVQYIVVSKDSELSRINERTTPSLSFSKSGYYYKIKCIDNYSSYTLTEIQIEESFDVDINSTIIITQLKGVFFETYRLNFDSIISTNINTNK